MHDLLKSVCFFKLKVKNNSTIQTQTKGLKGAKKRTEEN